MTERKQELVDDVRKQINDTKNTKFRDGVIPTNKLKIKPLKETTKAVQKVYLNFMKEQ